MSLLVVRGTRFPSTYLVTTLMLGTPRVAVFSWALLARLRRRGWRFRLRSVAATAAYLPFRPAVGLSPSGERPAASADLRRAVWYETLRLVSTTGTGTPS